MLIRRPDQRFQLGFTVQDGVICSLLRGGIAERGGIRVDHRIIEINGESVVAVPHEYIVHLLATAVGEVRAILIPSLSAPSCASPSSLGLYCSVMELSSSGARFFDGPGTTLDSS